MALAYDNSNSKSVATVSSTTITLTIGSNQPVVLVGVSIEGSAGNTVAVTSIKIGTTAFTRIGVATPTSNVNITAELWYLKAPPTGAQTITVSYAAVVTATIVGAISLSGASQTAPLGASDTAIGSGTPASKALITTANGSWIVDVLANDLSVAITSLAPAHGNTSRYSASLQQVNGAGSTLPTVTAGSNTDGWSWTNGVVPEGWGYVVAEILPDSPSISVSDASTTSESVTMDLISLPKPNDSVSTSENIGLTEIDLINVSIADQYQLLVDNGYLLGTTISQKQAQSFQPSTTAGIFSVAISVIIGDGSPSDAVKCEIYTDNAGIPGSLLIAADATISAGSLQLLNLFTFTNGPTLAANTTYWIVMSRTGSLDDLNTYDIRTASDFSDKYTRGGLLYYNGSSWGKNDITPGLFDDANFVYSYNGAVEFVTSSENLKILTTDTVSVNDSTTASESKTLVLIDLISVSDSTTTSENIGISMSAEVVSVSDSTTTSESLTVRVDANIAPNDSVITSEAVTPWVTFYLINLFDFQNVTDIRHNYVTNPSFEADNIGTNPPATYTTFTTINTGTLVPAVSSDSSFSGGQSWKITETGGVADAGLTSPRFTVTPGDYTVSHYMKTALTAGKTHMHVKIYSGSNVTAEYDFTSIIGTTGWTQYSLTVPVMQADTAIELWIGFGSFGDTFATGSVWYDAIQIEQGDIFTGYFDGSFPGAQWDGVANASASSTTSLVETVGTIPTVHVSDSATTSENTKILLDENIADSDAVSHTESVSINTNVAPDINLSVNDSSTTSEFTDVLHNKTRDISASDLATTSESVIFLDTLSINSNDSTKVIEGFLSMLNFNGTNQDVVTFYNSIIHPSVSVSVEAWAYHQNWGADTTIRDIYSNTESGGFALRINDAGQVPPAIGYTVRVNNSFQMTSTSMTGLASGWHLFSGTFDGRLIKIYVDGVLMSTKDLGSNFAIQYSFNNGSGIGSDVDSSSPAVGTGNYWSEQIGQVRVYANRVLSQTDITEHFNQTYTNETGIASVYYFPEGAGTTTLDASGNAITGTLVNAPTWQSSTMPQAGMVILDINVSTFETVTTAENTTLYSTIEPFTEDDITTAESTQTYVPFFNAITEDDTVTSEAVVFESIDFISVNDSTSTSESIVAGTEDNRLVSDASTTSESVSIFVDKNLSVQDSVTTSEKIISLLDEDPIVFDSVAVSESISFSGDLFVNVNDTSTLSENIATASAGIIVLDDDSLINDVPFISIDYLPSATDSVSTSESVSFFVDEDPIVNDSSSISESVTITLDTFYSFPIHDTATTAESLTVLAQDDISVSENAVSTNENLLIFTDDNSSVQDSTSTSESLTVYLDANISVQNSSSITETISFSGELAFSVSDSSSTAEAIALYTQINLSVSDSATTAENVASFTDDDISVNDSTTISELVSAIPYYNISASSTVTIAETVILLETSYLSVSDSTTISETFTPAFDTLDVDVSDSVTVSETIVIGQIKINVAEAVSVSELANVSLPRSINVFEATIHVNDYSKLITPPPPPPVIVAYTEAKPEEVASAYTDGGENI